MELLFILLILCFLFPSTGGGVTTHKVPMSPLAKELISKGYGRHIVEAMGRGGGWFWVDGRKIYVTTSRSKPVEQLEEITMHSL